MASVVPAILDPATGSADPSVREAMLLGSWLEGGWNSPYPVGDSGHSHGPYQINLPFHPDITAAEAEDPVYATQYMYGRYVSAVTSVNPTDWINQPEQAAEKSAYRAEGPLYDYYQSRGAATVHQGWLATIGVLQSAGQPLGPGGAGDSAGSGNPPPGGGSGIGAGAGAGGGSTNPMDDCLKSQPDQVRAIITKLLEGQYTVSQCDAAMSQLCTGATCAHAGAVVGSGVSVGDAVTAPVDAIAGIITSPLKALQFLFSWRGLELLAGLALVLVGVSALSKSLGGPSASDAVAVVK